MSKLPMMFVHDKIQELSFLLQHFQRRGIPIDRCSEKDRINDLVTELLIYFGLPTWYDYILFATVQWEKITEEKADEVINILERARTLVEFERTKIIFKTEFNQMQLKIFIQKNVRPTIPIAYLNDIMTGFYILYHHSADILEPNEYYISIVKYLQSIEQPVRHETVKKVVDFIFRYFKLISPKPDF